VLLFEPLENRLLLTFVAPASGRSDISLDASWQFIRTDVSGAQAKTFNDSSWSTVSLPHTWNALDAQDGGDNYYQGIGWYRKHFTIPSNLAGKDLMLKFDGAMLETNVYVNGTLVGGHKGGYSAFTFDITPFVKVGADNVLAVKVDNSNDPNVIPVVGGTSPDYPKWGGLYRDVHLLASNPIQINQLDMGSSGVSINQAHSFTGHPQIQIAVEMRDDMTKNAMMTATSIVVDHKGKVITTMTSAPTLVQANSVATIHMTSTMKNPHFWDGVNDPYLYTIYTQVTDGKNVTDVDPEPFGARYYSYDATHGFMLNGKPYDLHGVSYYTDRLNEGDATTAAQRAEDIGLIKEMGATTVRLAHFQHASDEYTLLDQDGLIAISEIPLGANYNDSAAFTNNLKQQLTEMMKQTDNHPSVVFLSLANEMPSTADANNLIQTLQTTAKALNSTLITMAQSNDYIDNNVLALPTDLQGFNKYYGWYIKEIKDFPTWLDSLHKDHPNDPVVVSEYGAGGSLIQHQAHPSKPVSTKTSLHPEEYEDIFHENYWADIKARPWILGSWAWSMFDTASDFRNEGDTPGRIDKGFITFDHKTKKDPFYFYKANWTTTPVLYITSRTWTDRPTATNDVKIYSNLPSVTLTINGKTIGTMSPNSIKIALWANQTLKSGANTIKVTGSVNGQSFSDSVTWDVMSTSATPASLAQQAPSLFSSNSVQPNPNDPLKILS
jgi:beta-galactosidase